MCVTDDKKRIDAALRYCILAVACGWLLILARGGFH